MSDDDTGRSRLIVLSDSFSLFDSQLHLHVRLLKIFVSSLNSTLYMNVGFLKSP